MIKDLSICEVIDRIENLNQGLSDFWGNADGWAPISAACLLSKSGLGWQVSLSRSLRLWIKNSPKHLEDGELILAWANLGSLIEGTMKLFLSVYYEDFQADIAGLKKVNIKASKPPDELTLEPLKVYFKKKNFLDLDCEKLIDKVQYRRNAIHAFKVRPIGDDDEFQSALRSYLVMLRMVNNQLPYPEDIYIPVEE